ncbi:MAG: cellulase family glycosylhydrolase [Terriglobales bacterium]
MNRASLNLLLLVIILTGSAFARPRWTPEQANTWYGKQPWLVGSNFIPSDAINELEMWQAETFNPQRIDQELGWAESLGMNTMRVFLHDLPWQQDAVGYGQRIDQFLSIASKHGIRPIFVLFDSCWDPDPKLGPQHPPIPGVHNSGWVQSPGAAALRDSSQYARLKAYVQGVVGKFASDSRVLGWDVWNEPSNRNEGAYRTKELDNKEHYVEILLPQVFEWARATDAIQPLTSGVWDIRYDKNDHTKIQRTQIEESDVISFHNYGWPEEFRSEVVALQKLGRPVLCTEYMARSVGSTFDTVLPIANELHIAAINWGFVAGKTQTYLPWDSWEHPYVLHPPAIWFHEVLKEDGTPYRQAEVDLIRLLISKSNGEPKANRVAEPK